jgi:hypothetical protein
MNRTGRAALVAAIVAFAAGGARAEDGVEWSWRLGGGTTFPIHSERLRDIHATGINLEAGLGVRAPYGFLVFGTYDFNWMFVDENGVTEYLESLDPSFDPGSPVDSNPTKIQTALAQAVYPFTSSVVARPYAIGGLGWMWVRGGDISYTGTTLGGDDESGFATALGAGIEFRVGPTLNAYVEAAWTVGFTGGETTQIVTVRIGIYH